MGVPVFNVILGVAAGLFVGRALGGSGADAAQATRAARQAALFATCVLGALCVVSALIALASASTASDVQMLLGLPFQVTPVMIIAIIVVGGATLLGLQWWLTAKALKQSYRWSVASAGSPGGAGWVGDQ